ncbi:hypothetical protein GN244_ATG18644 [Phytophthora infestans]|uniref:Uncharacterized protein n=1 Tax=Phytophthora infestans TaxID=4787 RepID=A0A833WDJ1_PHYIN|nr:hypothetical protein GN244_ATG18644 [Phytophthora infestans]
MADPAWGEMSSLSDEETARALCAFHQTEPLPTQRRRSPQQEQQHAGRLYHPGRINHDARAFNGISTFGYPVHTTHHNVNVSMQRNEATSVLVGMPSTSSDDWHRQQQRAIQEQIEQQQRELQAQLHQQQQREMHLQAQRMQTQIQQQEHAQRQQMESIRQRHLLGVGGFEQARWSDEVYTSEAAKYASNSYNGRRQEQRQQPGQAYNGIYGQLSARPSTALTPTPSFGSGYDGRLQVGMLMSRGETAFAAQQVPQSTQSHLQARNPGLFLMSRHEWGRHDPMLFNGGEADRTPQRTQQLLLLQPRPYGPIGCSERIRQEPEPVRSTTKSCSDEFVLDGYMKHFQRNDGSSAGAAAISTGATYDSNTRYAGTRNVKPKFNPSVDQTRIQSPVGLQAQGQLNYQSKVPVPPTGTAVVPGTALASQSMRLLCMRDLLNGDDGCARIYSSRNRPRGGKQKRAPPYRKMPKKKTASKRQGTPLLQNERKLHSPPGNRLAGEVQSRQGAGPAPIGSSGPVNKIPTPMYLAFMESRAARALEQTVGNTISRPTTALPPTSASQSATSSASRGSDQGVVSTAGGLTTGNRKKLENPTLGICHSSSTFQAYHLHVVSTSAVLQAAADVEAATCPQPHTREVVQMRREHHALVNGHVNGGNGLSSAPSIFERSIPVGGIKSGRDGASSRKRTRAKLPTAGLKLSTDQQQAPTTRASNEDLSTESGPKAANVTSVQTPAAFAIPRAENRTVVIFCKRDFMRYQAAKVWRKYQGQLKKHEEWREVRVAGKRTRYMNSRYDELQRTHKRTYTRSGKPRRKALQTAKGDRRRKTLLSSADSAWAESTLSSSMSVDNEIDSGQTANEKSADSGASFIIGDAHSSIANARVANNVRLVTVRDPSEAQEKQLPSIEDGTRNAVKSSEINDSRNGVVVSSRTHRGLDITDVVANSDAVANAPKCGTSEVTLLPDESRGKADGSVAFVPSKVCIEATEATPGSSSTTADTNPDANASSNGSAAPGSVYSCAFEATISRIDTIDVADAGPTGTGEGISMTPDSKIVAKAAKSVEIVAANTASLINMDSSTKMSEDAERYTWNSKAPGCGEQSYLSSAAKVVSKLQQDIMDDTYSCTDSATQDGTPPGQQTDAAAVAPIEDVSVGQDKSASSDGATRNTDAILDGSSGDIRPSSNTLLDRPTGNADPAALTPVPDTTCTDF